MMKFIVLILVFALTSGQHTLHAMAQHQENVKRLGEWLAESDNDEKHVGQTRLVTIPLDSPKAKKEKERLDALYTRTIHLIDRNKEKQANAIKFDNFFAEFKSETAKIWKKRDKTENEIINTFIRKFDEKAINENMNIIADGAQKAINQHYIAEYNNLYKVLFLKHFKIAASEDAANVSARNMYRSQSNCCCVIL